MAMVKLGQSLTSGRPAMGCPHMQEWLLLFTRLQIARRRIKTCLDIVQAFGDSPNSGGTHLQGTALDITQLDAGLIADAREAGARGTWPRGPKWGQKNMPIHTHLSLDCPCTSGSDYQVIAADNGYNGLGYRGEGGRDYVPAPRVRRDWAQGMEWMRGQLAAIPGRHRTVTVARGATLGGIAAALGVTLAALLSVNPQITDPNVIVPGQTITVPPQAPVTPVAPAPAPAPVPAPTPTAPKAPAATPAPKPSAAIKPGVRSARVKAYQLALRRLVGPTTARKLNPSGATGYYGPQTKALTRAAYQALARQNPRGGWLRGDLSVPGPKLLKRLGL